MASSPLQPTFFGVIKSTADALYLFEACLDGRKNHVPRRPHDRERGDIVKSGNCFVYEEKSSGIKRWTDGVSWSPSRILGNFLIYREVSEQFPPGEKKRATKKTKPDDTPAATAEEADVLREACGSLVNSYPFKEKGLIKKTISVTFQGITHHIVSYYTLEDFGSGRLQRPIHDPDIGNSPPRPELYLGQSFRTNIEYDEIVTNPYHCSQQIPQAQQQAGALMHGAPGAFLGEHNAVAPGMQPPLPQHIMPLHSLPPDAGDFGPLHAPNYMSNIYQPQHYHPHPPPPQQYDLQMAPQALYVLPPTTPEQAPQMEQNYRQVMAQRGYSVYPQGHLQEYYTGERSS